MIIGIDGNEANIEKRVGVNTYAYELIKNLRILQDDLQSRHKIIVYLKDKPIKDMPEETANFTYKIIPGSGNWILTKLTPSLLFERKRPDVFFSPNHYLPLFAPMPKVCSIMDLGYLEFSSQFTKKDFWQLTIWSAISIFVAKRVIAISKATGNDIVRHYTFSKGKVAVTQLAYDKQKFNNDIPVNLVRRIKIKYSIVDDYVLYLGTIKPSKNLEGLLTAFRLVSNDFPKIKLVIAGKKGWLYEPVFKKAVELGLSEKVIFTDFIQEEDKPALIKGAKVFVLPSFWEGFGLDALNSMACGVPVIASNTGSLPEVLGDAGMLVDPYDTAGIAAGIKRVLSMSESDYNSMVQKGIKRAGSFSWKTTAKETLKILETIK